MGEHDGGQRPREWVGYTPDGQRLVVRCEDDVWLVSADGGEPVRHHLLDLALIEAIRGDVRAHRFGIDYGEWTRLIADSIVSSWPRADAQ